MNDEKPTGQIDPEQEAALDRMYESIKREEEIARLKAQLGEYSRKLIDAADEIEAWKDASGLERGGDPDGVTPEGARKYWENIERIANQRDDAVNSYLNCRQDLEYCKHHAHQSSAYICGLVEKELLSESSRMGTDKATVAMNNAAGAAMCARRLRDSTPDGWPGGRIQWVHTCDDGDLPRIEALSLIHI